MSAVPWASVDVLSHTLQIEGHCQTITGSHNELLGDTFIEHKVIAVKIVHLTDSTTLAHNISRFQTMIHNMQYFSYLCPLTYRIFLPLLALVSTVLFTFVLSFCNSSHCLPIAMGSVVSVKFIFLSISSRSS